MLSLKSNIFCQVTSPPPPPASLSPPLSKSRQNHLYTWPKGCMLENRPWRRCTFGREVAWLPHGMNGIVLNSDLFTCTTWAYFVRLNFQHIEIRRKTTTTRHVSLFICFPVQNMPRPGFSVVHGWACLLSPGMTVLLHALIARCSSRPCREPSWRRTWMTTRKRRWTSFPSPWPRDLFCASSASRRRCSWRCPMSGGRRKRAM